MTSRVDGQDSETVALSDRGLQYGDGLFETILVRGGRPLLMEAHEQRLLRSAGILGIPLQVAALRQRVRDFLRAAPWSPDVDNGILKVLVTRGSGGRGYRPPADPAPRLILQWHALPPGIRRQREEGMAIRLCRHPVSINPVLAGLKHLNRLDQVLASRELTPPFEEGIMCDPDGRIVEGTRSNLFLVRDGVLQTPSLKRCGVSGIMKCEVVRQAELSGIPVQEVEVEPDDLAQAREVFITNSIIGIVPVIRAALAERDLQFPPGEYTRHLQGRLREIDAS